MNKERIWRFAGAAIFLSLSVIVAACQPIQPSVEEGGSVPVVTESEGGDVDGGGLAGEWAGDLTISGVTLRIALSLAEEEGVWSGALDVPQQAMVNLPIHSILVDGDEIAFQILEGGPLATFEGALNDEDVLSGSFVQANTPGIFTLSRVVASDAPTLPYIEEDVTFESPGATLAGTLTLPEGSGPFPALVLVTGSGQQNRDEEIPIVPGYRPFFDIADRLTQAGFAVLRYDDRGAGESTGDFALATTDDFVDDANAAIAYLRERPEIDSAQVGILGHSEGANVAARVAANDPAIAWAVAWAGTAVPGSEVIKLQAVLQARAGGMGEEELEALAATQNRAVDLMVAEDWAGLEEEIGAYIGAQFDALTPEQQASIGNREAAINQQVQAQLAAAQSPWFQAFLQHNPADDWRRVTSPVLAFFGELDTQVDPEQNRASLADALALNPDVTIVELPGVNHLFIPAVTGGAAEYASLDPTLLPEFLDILTSWLSDRANMVQ